MAKAKKDAEESQAKEPVTTDVEVNTMFEEDDIDTLIDESPVVNDEESGEEKKEEKQEKKTKKETKKEEEVQEESEKETEEPGEKEEEKVEKTEEEQVETEEQPEVPQKIKVGEREYDPEELESIAKQHDNMLNWEKELRLKSQLASNLTADQIEHILTKTKGFKEVPDPALETAEDVSTKLQFEKEYTLKDEDGVEFVLTGDQMRQITLPIIKNAVASAVKNLDPVIQKAKTMVRESQEQMATQAMSQLMEKHKEYRLNPPKGVNLVNHVANIEKTGPLHPDWKPLSKYRILLTTMRLNNIHNLEEAHDFFYGEHDEKVKAANKKEEEAKEAQENILKKQSQTTSEKPGSKSVEISDDDAFLAELDDPTETALRSIGAL